MNEEKKIKVDFMKVIVTILVVIAHVTRMYTGYGAISGYSVNNILKCITEFIYGFHMPLFFALSGLVFSICIENGKYKNKKNFIKNKFLRLMVPYFIFGIFYVAPTIVVLKITKLSYFECVIKSIFLAKDSRHLWYLITLFGIFLITLFIRPKKISGCIGAIIFSGVLLLVNGIFSGVISSIFSNTIYFYIGYLLNLVWNTFEKKICKNYYISIIIFILYCILYYININIYILKVVGVIMNFSILILIPVKFYKENRIYNILKKYSMGIYLFHPMIIYFLYAILLEYNINSYIQSISVILLSTLISIILTYLVKKVKLSFILGEKV